MTIFFKNFKLLPLLAILLLSYIETDAQAKTNEWKLQLAIGFNKPFVNDQSEGFATKNLNFPTINFGVQHMFSRKFGAKLDLGYNRASNKDNSPKFKFNYSRVNLQFVYEFSQDLFISERFATVLHLGPGMSFTKPLGNYSNNKHSFANVNTGLELHYGISETLSIVGDVSYIFSLSNSDEYNPAIDGFSFNGDLLTATIGLSVSLSGCRYCN